MTSTTEDEPLAKKLRIDTTLANTATAMATTTPSPPQQPPQQPPPVSLSDAAQHAKEAAKADIERARTDTLESIHKERDCLLREKWRLYDWQTELDRARRELSQKQDRLYARCSHSREKKYRPWGLYADTEWHCPDCGREI